MRFALFLGCNIPARVETYELSSGAILRKLGVDLVDVREFKCCGYPIRNFDFKTFLISSARNLALAGKRGLDMLVLCKCCYGSLKMADHVLRNDEALQEEMNSLLASEGLKFEGNSKIKHFLSVLYHDIGIDKIREHISRPYKDLKIATHYGCHALRPSSIVQFDDPVSPSLFDQLVEATGAESIDWQTKLECCGAPLLGVNDALSMDLAMKKLEDGGRSGAHYLCTACPYCHLQFEAVRNATEMRRGNNHVPAPLLYVQLLGLAMGMDKNLLTVLKDQRDINTIEAFLA